MRIVLQTQHPVAITSPDHIMPWGTRRDSSRNCRFVQKLSSLGYSSEGQLKVLDLGCSGGGFIRDVIEEGWLGVGLEGSDFSKKHRRAEWATIPDNLFTCDATKPFTLLEEESEGKSRPLIFDVITSWELIEHIAEGDLPSVADNVRRHLRNGGLWILSVSPNEEIINGVVLHQTVRGRTWWIRTFASLGFTHHETVIRYFNTQFVRGPKFGAPGSFHLALVNSGSDAPRVPGLSLRTRMIDAWHGSSTQRLLQKAIIGKTL